MIDAILFPPILLQNHHLTVNSPCVHGVCKFTALQSKRRTYEVLVGDCAECDETSLVEVNVHDLHASHDVILDCPACGGGLDVRGRRLEVLIETHTGQDGATHARIMSDAWDVLGNRAFDQFIIPPAIPIGFVDAAKDRILQANIIKDSKTPPIPML